MSPALVFLAGMGASARGWAAQEKAFCKSRRVYCWNAPGYGGTPLPADPSFSGYAAHLARDMSEAGIDRAVLVGHSFGAMVAQQMAADIPERLAGLVLAATSPAFGNKDGAFQKQFVEERVKPLDEGRTMSEMADAMIAASTGRQPDRDGLALARRCMSEVPAETYRAITALITTFDQRANLGHIAVPTLVMAGELDRIAPAPMMRRMASLIPAARFVEIANSGHLIPFEQPAAFNAALCDFLKEIDDE